MLQIILTVLIIAVLELSYLQLKPWWEKRRAEKREKEKITTDDGVTALHIVKEFLGDNGCKPDYYDLDDESFQGMSFTYTGGQYIAHASKTNKNFLLIYPNFMVLPADTVQLVNAFADSRSSALRFFKVSSSFEEADNTLNLSISYETMTLTMEDLNRVVGVTSALADELRQQLNEYIQKVDHVDAVNASRREMYMLAESELLKNIGDAVISEFSIMTIGSLIAYLYDYEKQDDYDRLVVVRKDEEQPYMLTQDIANVLLSDLVTSTQHTENSPQVEDSQTILHNAQLTLSTTNNIYLISMRLEGDSEQATYYRVTALRESRKNLQETHQAIPAEEKSILIGFDKADDEKHRLEFRYMFLDALDKQKEGRDDELTDAQKMLLGLKYNEESRAIYEARKMYTDNRFYEVVALLVPVFNNLKPRFFGLSKRKTECFFEICYLIGMSYYKMQCYEKSFYYLELTNSCGQYRYSMGYVNLMVDDNDVRVFREINALHDVLQKAVRDNDSREPTEEQLSFYEFLERRRGTSYMTFGDLNEAETIFKDLLESEDSKQYAEEKLKQIEEMRKGLSNKD